MREAEKDEDRAGATAKDEPVPGKEQAQEPTPIGEGLNRTQRRAMAAEARRLNAQLEKRAKEVSEVESLRSISMQINETAKRAVAFAREVWVKAMEVARVDCREGAFCLVTIPEGADMSDEALDGVVKLTGMPVLVLERGSSIESLSAERLEAAGWVRRLTAAPAPEGNGA